MASPQALFTAFADQGQIASGSLTDVALTVKARFDADDPATVLIFNDETGEQTDLDLSGTTEDVIARLHTAHQSGADESADAPTDAPARMDERMQLSPGRPGPGRPRLGVVSREVTLLPRHWDWLAAQPGGASAALRRLVDAARRNGHEADRTRRAQEATYKVMRVLAGNLPGFEESSRALFALDMQRFSQYAADWPADVCAYLLKLSEPLQASGRIGAI